MSYDNLTVEREDRIVLVTVNRPHKLNALDRRTFEELAAAFAAFDADPAAGAAIVTGAGGKAFVAGADISNLDALSPLAAREWCLLGQRVFSRIEAASKPVIAAVNGWALGAGLELAMACHLRVAAVTARLGQPEVKIGWIPANGGSQRLPRLIGKGRALEMMLTGEPVTADEACRIGLVNRVAPAAELLDAARSLARKILENSPTAVALCLEAVGRGLEMPFEQALALEAALGALAGTSEDALERIRAFLEKRARP
jgi:enoyl-CoA hydratase